MTKSKRGGKREPPGGRPKVPKEEQHSHINFSLPPDIVEWIKAYSGNRSGFVAEAIREKIARMTVKK